MTTKDCRMKGMPWVSSYLIVSDVEKSITFYQKAFGFEVAGDISRDENGKAKHCELKYKDAVIMIGKPSENKEGGQPPALSSVESPMSLYVYCENVDHFCKQAKENRAEVLSEPEDSFWG